MILNVICYFNFKIDILISLERSLQVYRGTFYYFIIVVLMRVNYFFINFNSEQNLKQNLCNSVSLGYYKRATCFLSNIIKLRVVSLGHFLIIITSSFCIH